jgi:hypothetical protein
MMCGRGRSHCGGASIAEFLIAVLLVFLPLALGTLQVALLAVDKDLLNLGATMGARSGAVNHGSRRAIREEVARALIPLYGEAAAMARADSVAPVLTAYGRALADTAQPHVLRVKIRNPTADSFADFEREHYGVRGIPNVHLEHADSSRVGARSHQSLVDANTLSIEVRYCARLIVPLADRMITAVLSRTDPDLLNQQCYRERRVPISADAVVMMQSEARRAAIGL